jgi:hypothetical protein
MGIQHFPSRVIKIEASDSESPTDSAMTDTESWSVVSNAGSSPSECDMSCSSSEAGEDTTSRTADQARGDIIADGASDDDANQKTSFWAAFGEGEFIDPAEAAEILNMETKDSASSIPLSSYLVDPSFRNTSSSCCTPG